MGRRRSKYLMMASGRMSKCLLISLSITASDILPVPKVSMETESGWATPIE